MKRYQPSMGLAGPERSGAVFVCRYTLCACVCKCVKEVSAADNNIESSVRKTRKLWSILLPSQIYMSKPKWLAFCVCVIVLWQTCIPARKFGSVHLARWTLKQSLHSRSVSLCACSFFLPVFLHHIINSVTVCSKAPCLVVHIQSCRLKQIAICIPLGEKSRGKHHSSSHLCI